MPSDNTDNAEITGHPLGFTAQIKRKNHMAQIGAQSGSQAQWWTQGNGQGTEKWDAFEEAARFSSDQDDFENKVALQGNFLPAINKGDGEPSEHPMGFSFVQREAPHSDELL